MVGRQSFIKSPDLNEGYFVENNRDVTDFICPIDRTRLLHASEDDFNVYKCLACGASYKNVSDNEELKKSAKNYAVSQLRKLLELREYAAHLERIVDAAKKNGLLSR